MQIEHALLLVTGIAGCEPDREDPPRRPDILFVILDTLRAVQIEANSEAPIELDPKMRHRLQSLGYGS
jgi:hypothetical protein